MPIKLIIVIVVTAVFMVATASDRLWTKTVSEAMRPIVVQDLPTRYVPGALQDIAKLNRERREKVARTTRREAIERTEAREWPVAVGTDATATAAFWERLAGNGDPRSAELARQNRRRDRRSLEMSLWRYCPKLGVGLYSRRTLASMPTVQIAALVFLGDLALRHESSDVRETAGLLFKLVRMRVAESG